MKYIEIKTIELVECPQYETQVGIRCCKGCEEYRIVACKKEIGCMYNSLMKEFLKEDK